MMWKNNLIFKGFLSVLLIYPASLFAQSSLLSAEQGDAYDQLSDAGYGLEMPDSNHSGGAPHVTTAFDSELGKYVFVFHSHPGDDESSGGDRVRTETKNNGAARGVIGDTRTYSWKFKLESDFQANGDFCHIHQIHPDGGGAALFTLTCRSNRVEVFHVADEDGSGGLRSISATHTPLSEFRGVWVQVVEKITFDPSDGEYSIIITRVDNGDVLMQYSNDNIDTWHAGKSYQRPKWGMYRRTSGSGLQDETIRFDDFCYAYGSDTGCNGGGGGGAVPDIGTGTTQAEDFNLSDYVVETDYNGETVVKPSSSSTGYINAEFDGNSGNYDISVRYFDEDDGQASITLMVDGSTVGSTTFTADDNAWHTWTVSGVSISDGDEIRIEGANPGGEHGRLDEVTIDQVAASIGTGTTQAESLTLVDYEIETGYNGETVVKPTSSTVGSVSGEFDDSSGNYDISVRYFDEDDGQASITLKVDGSTVGSTTFTADDNAWHTWTVSGVSISDGDEIRIEGANPGGEHGRLDEVTIAQTSSLPSIGTGTTQAESLNLSGFEADSFEGATCVRASSTTPGYVNGSFTGSTGTYDLTIRHHDENDGAATLTVKVEGSTVGTRTFDVDDHTWKDWTISDVSIANGDEIRLEGARESGEHLRVDYLQVSSGGARVASGMEDELLSGSEDFMVYPNPLHAQQASIAYKLAEASHVELSIYNVSGQQISTLVNERQEAGNYVAKWDALNAKPGLYMVKMVSGDQSRSVKFILER